MTETNEDSEEAILDNNELIENLEFSKIKSQNVKQNIIQAESLEVELNEKRNVYRDIARRGSILYFSIVDMSGIDPMYQNSLKYVKLLFNEAIQSQRKVPTALNQEQKEILLRALVDAITLQLYEKICFGLFE